MPGSAYQANRSCVSVTRNSFIDHPRCFASLLSHAARSRGKRNVTTTFSAVVVIDERAGSSVERAGSSVGCAFSGLMCSEVNASESRCKRFRYTAHHGRLLGWLVGVKHGRRGGLTRGRH